MHSFYTIGHSTRTIEEFLTLLRGAHVNMVVDVRTVPKSRTNPQYNLETFPNLLASFDIGHRQIAELGGLRAKVPEIQSDVNGFWENRSFHNYADHALTESFRTGLDELIALGKEHRCAIMCAEAVWWRCHRRIIADHLIARGESVFHLMGKDKIERAKMTEGSQVLTDGTVVYPKNRYKHG